MVYIRWWNKERHSCVYDLKEDDDVNFHSCFLYSYIVLTFDEHPKKVGQMEVMQENDDDARSFVGLASVQLPNK
jgi:hypothetical protein